MSRPSISYDIVLAEPLFKTFERELVNCKGYKARAIMSGGGAPQQARSYSLIVSLGVQ